MLQISDPKFLKVQEYFTVNKAVKHAGGKLCDAYLALNAKNTEKRPQEALYSAP